MTNRKNAHQSKRRIKQNSRPDSLVLWVSVLAIAGLIVGGVFLNLLLELCRLN